MNKKEIPREEVIGKIIKESGHNLHVHVANYLSERGYQTDISPYYVDAYTEKPREVDIIATKSVPLYEYETDEKCELILALDCKYLTAPTVFWMFNNKKHQDALKTKGTDGERIIQQTGEPGFIYFTTNPIARLFQSAGRGTDDGSSDAIFKACYQAISGTIFAREHAVGPAFIYPVVIVDGPGGLFDANDPSKPLENLIVHIDFSYPSRTEKGKDVREPFYVFIVQKENLDKLCSYLEKEIDTLRIYERGKNEEGIFNQRNLEQSRRERLDAAREDLGIR